jgi:hypothetical protein
VGRGSQRRKRCSTSWTGPTLDAPNWHVEVLGSDLYLRSELPLGRGRPFTFLSTMPPPPPQSATLAWAPAKLGTAPTVADGSAVPRELLELAKQLALVEHQRQQLVLKTHGPSTPPASPVHQRRPSSPATTILTPLPASPSKPVSLGLAPALVYG